MLFFPSSTLSHLFSLPPLVVILASVTIAHVKPKVEESVADFWRGGGQRADTRVVEVGGASFVLFGGETFKVPE